MPSISVIIPCHNSELFVRRAIDSVLCQSFKDFEIILVDNHSTDGTLAVLNEYAEAHPAFIRRFEEPRKGAPFARNRGLAEANGEWLQFLDSDDELLVHKLEHQFELAKHNRADLIVGNFIYKRDDANENDSRVVRSKSGNPWQSLIESKLGKTSSLLWRKEAVAAAGGWNEAMTSSQEYELLFRMLKKGAKIEYVDLAETIHYVRKNSISHSGSNARTMEILNNYVDLRMAIKSYLLSKGQFTRTLRHAIGTSIYYKLLPYKKRIPDYWRAKLDETQPQLPLRHWLGQQAKKARGWWEDARKDFSTLLRQS